MLKGLKDSESRTAIAFRERDCKKEPSLQLIGGEQSHGDRAIVRRKLIG